MTLQPIPRLPSLPIMGSAHLLEMGRVSQSFIALSEQYGPVFEFKRPSDNDRMIIIGDHKLVAELTDETRFQKDIHKVLQRLRPLGGDGLFTADSDEPNWGIAHRVLMPAFGPVAIRAMFDPMRDIADQMFTRWERFGDKAVIDVADDMTRLTLDTIALCAFNARFNSFYNERMHPFVDAMLSALYETELRNNRPELLNNLLFNNIRRFERDTAFMGKVADDIIAERQAQPRHTWPNDLLSRMLSGRDPETGQTLSAANIRYQMITFLIAGHETTSGMLSFAVHNLLQNPEVQDKARALVDQVVGDGPITVHHLKSLGYIEQILKESLRIWPTAPAFGVRPLKPTILGGRFAVEPRDTLLIFTPTLHRDPTAWENPEVFQPERFDPDRLDDIPDSAYKPFGNGSRACIGRAFAMQEATLVLAGMLQKFHIELDDPGYELVIKETLTLKPEGLKIRVRRRTPSQSQTLFPSAAQASNPNAPKTAHSATALTVLFGSDTGTGETFARQLATEARQRGAEVRCEHLDDHVGNLPKEGVVCIIVASYLGEPTRDARKFMGWLETLEEDSQQGTRFAVFGCGDRHWRDTYQSIPIKIDGGLERAGAQRLLTRGEGDASGDIVADFEQWLVQLWQVIGAGPADTSRTEALTVDILSKPQAADAPAGFELATVLQNDELTDTSSPLSRSKRHLALQLPTGMTYRAGDYLAIQPTNPPSLVQRALEHFALDPQQQLRLGGHAEATHLPLNQTITAFELLERHVELNATATPSQIRALAALTRCPPEKATLEALITSPEVSASTMSVLDLLQMHASCQLDLAAFLAMLRPVKARTYSISSSPLETDGQCTLTVAVVQGPARSGLGQYSGVASTFLARAEPGQTIPVAVHASPAPFHLPSDPTTPLVLIAAGSGIAPMRGFLQERHLQAQRGIKVGKALLYFGCDHPQVDLLYSKELQAWADAGIVEVKTAFSQQPKDGIKYVQDKVRADTDWIELAKGGAHLYVCGGKAMAQGVRRALRESLLDFDTVVRHYAEDVFT